MKSRIFRVLLLLMMAAGMSHAQVLTQAEYFVDVDPGAGLATPLVVVPGDTVTGSFSFSVNGLSPGYHWLYIRSRDIEGRWGIARPSKFYVYGTQPSRIPLPEPFPITQAEYFFDSDPGSGNGTALPLIRGDTVDVSRFLRITSLDTGYHYLYLRTMDQTSRWGLTQRIRFHVDTARCLYPLADFTFDTATFGTPCHFTNLSQDTVPGATFLWKVVEGPGDTVFYSSKNILHTFDTPGVYKVEMTVTNSAGCSASVIHDVMTGPLPDTSILVAGSLMLCSGDSVILTSDNYEEGTRFHWNTGDTTQAITVKTAGTYYCWVTNEYGIFLRSETISVVVHHVPTVTLSVFHATGGNNNGSAWADVAGGSGNTIINWSHGATGAVVNNLAAGDYSVTVTDGNCPVIRSFTILNNAVHPGDIVSAEYFFDTDPGVGNATPLNIAAGDSVAFRFDIPLTGLAEGYHHLYIRTKNSYGVWGLDARHKIYISPVSFPPPAEQPLIVQAEYFIDTDPGIGHGVNIPLTSGDTVTPVFPLPTAGMEKGFYRLYVRAKDAQGKWGHHGNALIYLYDSVHYDLNKPQKSIAGVEYFFDTDPGIPNALTLVSNIYDTIDLRRDIRVGSLLPGLHRVYIRAYDERGVRGHWRRSDFNVLNVNCTCPVVDFDVDTVNLLGVPTQFVNLSTGTVPNATYEWDVNGDGIIDYTTPDVTHVYPQFGLYNARLTVRNTTDCHASMTRQVVVSPPVDTTLTIQGELTFCDGDSVTLTAQPGYRYNWNNDRTTQSITVKQSGDYSVRLTNIYGVQGFSRRVRVTVHPVPEVEVVAINANTGQSNGTAICNASGGTGLYSYHWSTGAATSLINNLAAGTYSVTVSDGRCPVVRNFTIGSDPVLPGDLVKAEYFYDTDPGVGNATPLNIAGGDSLYFATLLPVTGLSPGYHQLYIRTADSYGRWSLYADRQFLVYDSLPDLRVEQPPLVAAEYFYDVDPGVGQGTRIPLTAGDQISDDFIALTDGLDPGFHKLVVRTLDTLGRWSLSMTHDIYIHQDFTPMNRADSPKLVAAEYFFDTDPGTGNGVPLTFSPTGDLIDLQRFLHVDVLPAGAHYVYLRVQDEAGNWSHCSRASFDVVNTPCVTPAVDFATVPVTAGQQVTFVNTSLHTHSGTLYTWDIGNDGTVEYTSKDFTHTFNLPGNYVLKMTAFNSDTCKASVLKEIQVGPLPSPVIVVGGNTLLCEGDSVLLTAAAGFAYAWWPTGETTQSVYAKTGSDYYCWISTPAGVEIKSEVVAVEIHSYPEVILHVQDASGGQANGSAWAEVSGGSGNYQYQWSSGGSDKYVNHLTTGVYTFQVDDGHCPVNKQFTITDRSVVPGNIVAAEYFFDTDPGAGSAIPMNISAGDSVEFFTGCQVTGLQAGYHTLFVRVRDTEGRWSLVKEHRFYLFPSDLSLPPASQPPISNAEYFVDLNINRPDPGVGLGTPVALTPAQQVDVQYGFSVDTLVVGFHQLAVRVKDSVGTWSLIHPATFYLYDTTYRDVSEIQPSLLAAEYFIDTDPGVGQGTPLPVTPGESIAWSGGIPMGSLAQGAHQLYIRAKDVAGKWGLHRKAGFNVYNCTQPTADFTFVPTCITSPVQFQDISANVDPAATYAWDINNDGVTDYTTHGSISHQYTVPGIYQVKLKITHNVACVDSVVKTVVFPYVFLPADTTIYTDQEIVLDAGPGYTYLWSTGATTQTVTISGATAGNGIHSVSVTVTDANQCTATDALNITVMLPPRDLLITAASLNPEIIPENGDSAMVESVILNGGTIAAAASVVSYYRSTDQMLSPDDQLLGFGITGALTAGTSQIVRHKLYIPPGIDGEVWYLLFEADGTQLVTESNEGNNAAYAEFSYGPMVVPVNLNLGGQSIGNGDVNCFNAQEVVTVAGNGSTFQVATGGSATIIAGEKIRFLPGMKVLPGGYLHGYITLTGDYCFTAPSVQPFIGANIQKVQLSTGYRPDFQLFPNDQMCHLFPNPTGGDVSIVIHPEVAKWPVRIQIYNAFGVVSGEDIIHQQHEPLTISLKDRSPGIYFVHISTGDRKEIKKVIKY